MILVLLPEISWLLTRIVPSRIKVLPSSKLLYIDVRYGGACRTYLEVLDTLFKLLDMAFILHLFREIADFSYLVYSIPIIRAFDALASLNIEETAGGTSTVGLWRVFGGWR